MTKFFIDHLRMADERITQMADEASTPSQEIQENGILPSLASGRTIKKIERLLGRSLTDRQWSREFGMERRALRAGGRSCQ